MVLWVVLYSLITAATVFPLIFHFFINSLLAPFPIFVRSLNQTVWFLWEFFMRSHYEDTINRFKTKKVMLCTVYFIAMFMQLFLLEMRDTLSFVSEIRLANLCVSDHTCIEVLFSYLYFLNSLSKIFGVQYMTHSTVKLLNNKTVERWYSLKSLTIKCFCTRAYAPVVYSVLYFCPDPSVCCECLSQQKFWVFCC